MLVAFADLNLVSDDNLVGSFWHLSSMTGHASVKMHALSWDSIVEEADSSKVGVRVILSLSIDFEEVVVVMVGLNELKNILKVSTIRKIK